MGEYQNGTSYNINQLVSYNNNLYLSKEDNNNTTPPSDKWLLINKDTISVDLSDYPTKLEVEAIKNNLQQSITSNTTNITNLNNEVVKIAGNQIITGAKTFDNQVIIRKDGTPLILRAVAPGKIYMLMKGADDAANFSLGANSSNTSLEVNRGDLTIKTQQANKNIAFENAARIKFNRSVLEMGTEINAGFGGGEVKFIPEDNSTKTLKFYNNQPSDTRSFKLLVPEPTEEQNPTTKQYVDNLNNQNVKLTGDQSIGGNKTFTQPITIPTPTTDNNAATKAYVDNAIQNITPGSGGSIDTSNFATLNTNQTISGQKTFTNRIFANGGITNLPNPTNTQEAANKQYVDNKTSLYTMFSSNTIYNNLQKITTRLFDNSAVDYNKPLTVSFTRTNNSGTDYGSYIFQIQYGVGENNFVVGSNLYYDRSKTYGQLGDWVALTITPSYIQVQCWNGWDRIKNIKVQGWKKV